MPSDKKFLLYVVKDVETDRYFESVGYVHPGTEKKHTSQFIKWTSIDQAARFQVRAGLDKYVQEMTGLLPNQYTIETLVCKHIKGKLAP
jgi:hypothetical protein